MHHHQVELAKDWGIAILAVGFPALSFLEVAAGGRLTRNAPRPPLGLTSASPEGVGPGGFLAPDVSGERMPPLPSAVYHFFRA